ncbi:MAG: hypothetical protein WBN03_10715, partial [Desulfobacterales bacterium]
FLHFRALPAGRLNAQKLRTYFFANPKAGRVGSKRQLETGDGAPVGGTEGLLRKRRQTVQSLDFLYPGLL